jgi:putative NIF3 family GTP cyclohydrolase 1 type 2
LVRVTQIAEAVEKIAPLPLTEEWDNCGLQVGDPEAGANRVLVALTPSGDIDYHDALLAESLGLVVIDAGHAATELPSLEPLALRLGELVDVPVDISRAQR